MRRVDNEQALAFRLAGQGLAARADDAQSVLGRWSVQDSPPGAAASAALARGVSVGPGWLDDALFGERSAVAIYNARTATAVLPAREVAAYGTALLPDDDVALRAIVGSAFSERREGFAEPVARAVDAIASALDGRTLSRDDLHEELRRRLPGELLPWCEGCQSHHARRGLLVMAALNGRLCVAGRTGRQPAFARTDQWTGWDPPPTGETRAELVRRYLGGYGPSTPVHFAEWAGLAPAHARSLWDLVAGEFTEVMLAERRRGWLLSRDEPVLDHPPAAPGVRLLAPGDPLLLARDRETLVGDPEVRKRVWRAIGGAGIVLADGRPVALWRARKQGKRLVIAVDELGPTPRAEVAAEAERLAPLRGAASVEVDWNAAA